MGKLAWGRTPQHHAGALVEGQRRVAIYPDRSWPYEPEDCDAGPTSTVWVLDGKVLLCRGCGLDVT